MASTPSNRLKLTPANSPFLARPSRSPVRTRAFHDSSRLSLQRVVGTTCAAPTGFDATRSSFAYIAGGAVVVVDVRGDSTFSQRFYRARPTAVPVYTTAAVPHAPATPNSTPKANDSRNRVAPGRRESTYGPIDWSSDYSPSAGRTWTQRERIKTATCLSLSRDERFLAVGETGYAPRVLIFNLHDNSSDIPLVSISEHTFGVNAVAWSPDTRYLASLGAANDGFLYLWKVDPRTGAAKLFQQNRCTSSVRGMIWMGNNLITFGVRHIKVWRVDDGLSTSPVKPKFPGEGAYAAAQAQRTLPGRNILLGSLLEATFSCAADIGDGRAIVCSETGDVCLLDDTNKQQMKLTRLRDVGFAASCISIRNQKVLIGGKSGQFATLSMYDLLNCGRDAVVKTTQSERGILAMGYLNDKIVTIDSKRSIDVWNAEHVPGSDKAAAAHIPIPGHGDPIVGIQSLPTPNEADAAFYTWSGSGEVILWSLNGKVKATLDVPIEQAPTENELDPTNQLSVVRATRGGKLFVTADRLGILRITNFASKDCVMETKAHSSDCQSIAIYEDDSKVIMASCGRDRTAQLFLGTPAGAFEHFQTLEFAAKVVQVLIPSDDKVITCSFDRTLQVHDLVSKEDEPDVMAAIPNRVMSLKASPSSMAMAPDGKSVYVSLLDRSICQYEIATGTLMHSWKCTDEGGVESVVLDSLIYGQTCTDEPTFLLALSNTDKSVRVYDSQTGTFLDREWGHTEAINGVALVDDEYMGRRVVSVGSDGTIMVWALDLRDPVASAMSRDPSPAKESFSASARPPLRKVLSKAELAEFQRAPPMVGRRSPPRTLSRRTSRYGLSPTTTTTIGSNPALLRSPIAALPPTSPPSAIAEASPPNTASAPRRASSGSPRSPSRSTSPSPSPLPPSPKSRVTRRPSLPAMRSSPSTPTLSSGPRKKSSASSLRGAYRFGSLSMATEQAARTLRAYRAKLGGADAVAPAALAELDRELRLTAAALGERVRRREEVSEELNGLLDEKLERLVCMLDEKWGLKRRGGEGGTPGSPAEGERSETAGTGSGTGSSEGDAGGEGGSNV